MNCPFFHGGAPKLKVGSEILPTNITGAKSLASYGANGICRRDRVYVTTSIEAAMLYAGMHPSGKGQIYAVQPIGELEEDPDCSEPNLSFSCEKAKILMTVPITNNDRKRVQKAMRG